MSQQKIQLYKIRDFGAKINATVEYIRQNILSLLKVVLLIVAPLGFIMAIFFSSMLSTISQASLNPQMNGAEGLSFMGALGFNYMLITLLSLVTFAFFISALYGYMLLNDKSDTQPAPLEVLGKVAKKIPMLVVLMILISIVSFVGFIFLFIPGIYLMVTLSLALPIYVFEDAGVGEAFSKSFKLIKGKWWSTFGLLLITSIIATVVSYIVAIPLYAGFMANMFSSLGETSDPSEVLNVMSSWYVVVGMGLMMIVSYLTYLIPLIALGFQYFNLSERVEGRGIRNQIDEFETVS